MSRNSGVWPIQYYHYMPGESLRVEMMRGAYKLITHCANVKPGEKVVISTDTNKLRIAECLAGATLAVGGVPVIVMIPPTGAHGAQLPEPVVAACEKCDVFFLPATYSQTHTDARVRAIANGARGTTMCEVTEDLLCTGAILGDFEECDARGRRLGAALSKAKKFRFKTAEGTDLEGIVEGRPVQYETGLFRNPGDFAAVPNSEINISPVEGTANGKVVVNVRIMNVGVVKDEPVTLTVKDGIVVKAEGSPAAKDLWNILSAFDDPTAFNVAEFGLGLNPVSRMYANNLEDLGKWGTGHMGIGSNYAIGGKVKAPCHVDVSFSDVQVFFDDKLVYEKDKVYV
ncbi:MAG: aminopeptidase [Peptococcaceae bacterium]|nr:aminopeptidase [Peptococcaceae bacterium]